MWTSVLVLGGLALTGLFKDRWYLGWALASAVLFALLLARLGLRRRLPDVERYALPVVALLGPTRIVFFSIGIYAVVRGLGAYVDGGDNDSEIAIVAIGLLLLLLAIGEQGFVTRARRTGSGRDPVMAKLDLLIAEVSKAREAMTKAGPRTAATRHRTPRGQQPPTRPLWLVTLVTVALLALGGYVTWKAIGETSPAVAPLVLAGLAFVLAVMGERLANLSFKLGTMEATLSDKIAPASGGGSPPSGRGGGGGGGDGQPVAHGLANVSSPEAADLSASGAALLFSPENETFSETLTQLLEGNQQGVMFPLGPEVEKLLEQGIGVVAPAAILQRQGQTLPPVRELTIKGPTDDVAALLSQMLGGSDE